MNYQNSEDNTTNRAATFLEKLSDITTFVFDVDGVLTDGSILAKDNGELLRTFNIKDGYALNLAVKKGYNVCIISGGSGVAMQMRFSKLGLKNIFLGVGNKVEVFENYIKQNAINALNVLYMGDDIPDFKVMQLVGLACCPADAVPEIKAISDFISPYRGGKTAVRDIIEKVLKVQDNWFDADPTASDSGK